MSNHTNSPRLGDRNSEGLVLRQNAGKVRWHRENTESGANLGAFTADGGSAEERREYDEASAALTASINRFISVHGRPPVIGVDLDGTTADMVAGLRERMATKRGVHADDSAHTFPQPDDYAMWQGTNAWFETKADFIEHFTSAERDGLYRDLPVYGGAALTLDKLKDHGCDLVAVTARSADYNDDSYAWIQSENLPLPPEIINSGFSKGQVEGVDVFLDDAPSVVTGLLDAGRKVVVFDQDYNGQVREDDLGHRVPSWGTPVMRAIAALLDQVDG